MVVREKALERRNRRKKKTQRIRKRISGLKDRPTVKIFRSLNHIYAQLFDAREGRTHFTVSTLSKELKGEKAKGNILASQKVGELLAKKAIAMGIRKVAFDRSGYLFHGRVKALAETARSVGLEF